MCVHGRKRLGCQRGRDRFFVVVNVEKPFTSEECGEVLAAVFCAESVLVGSVGVGLLKARYKSECVKTFNCFGKYGGEVDCAVVSWVAR